MNEFNMLRKCRINPCLWAQNRPAVQLQGQKPSHQLGQGGQAQTRRPREACGKRGCGGAGSQERWAPAPIDGISTMPGHMPAHSCPATTPGQGFGWNLRPQASRGERREDQMRRPCTLRLPDHPPYVCFIRSVPAGNPSPPVPSIMHFPLAIHESRKRKVVSQRSCRPVDTA